jgi:hypothetical protein
MMKNNLNNTRYIHLLNNITECLKTHEIVREYKVNNINKNRLDLYKDFIINLCYYVVDTYFGDEYIKTNKQKKEHFTWCFDKICNDFMEEDINFKSNIELYDYFFEYFKATMYDNDVFELEFFIDYWEQTLEYSFEKTKSDLDGLIEIYKIFDKSINQKIKL